MCHFVPFATLLGLATTVAVVLGQSAPQTSIADLTLQETKLYGGAHPYIDDSLRALKKSVEELAELKDEPDQGSLAKVLAGVAGTSDTLLTKLPNLISDETVSETQWRDDQRTYHCLAEGCFDAAPIAQTTQHFNYIILAHNPQAERLELAEFRTTRDAKPVAPAQAPHFWGFASSWALFSSYDQKESRFRFLGQQKIDGRATFVVAFAQIPGAAKYPGRIMTTGGSIPMLLQGIVWVDQLDFRIMRLRTDLLAPQPQIGYQSQTANIRFGAARIPALGVDLWLPNTVEVDTRAEGQLLQERHKYTKYRLYQTTHKIILNPNS